MRHTALWLNAKGIEKAAATAGVDLDGKMMLYASEAFSWSNNGCSAKDQQQRQLEWLAIYDRLNLPLEAVYVATAFGCQMQGEVPLQAVLDIVDFVRDLCAEQSRPLPSIFLGDTVGWGNPEEIKRRVNAVRERAPGMRVGLHLHDTRGMGAANFYAALQEGVDLFDSSIGGLGGCPFCNHANMQAAGNICTEDMVQLCHELGIETGIDLDRLIEASRLAEEIIGRTLAGKVMHSDSLDASAPPCARPRRGAGMSDALLFSVDDGIATLTINRPAQRNAINIEVNSRLYEAWETIDSRPDIRVAILTSADCGTFCAGMDLKEAARVRRKRARTSCGRSRIRSRRACAG